MIDDTEEGRRARRATVPLAGERAWIHWTVVPPRRDVDVVEKRVEKLEERVSALEESRQT